MNSQNDKCDTVSITFYQQDLYIIQNQDIIHFFEGIRILYYIFFIDAILE